MKYKRRSILMSALLLSVACHAQAPVTVTQNGLETTMSNGIISLVIGTNGRINTLTYNNSENLIGSNDIYFDFTRNTLTYSGGNGSGVMWDCLKLEAGPIVTDAISNTLFADDGKLYVYTLQGRLVGVFNKGQRHSLPIPQGVYIYRTSNGSRIYKASK